MITNGFTYVAVLLFMAAVLVTLSTHATGSKQKCIHLLSICIIKITFEGGCL